MNIHPILFTLHGLFSHADPTGRSNILLGFEGVTLPPRVAPPSKLDSGPFEIHSKG